MPRAAPVTTACGEFGSPAMRDSPRMSSKLPDRIYFILQALANESARKLPATGSLERQNQEIDLLGRACADRNRHDLRRALRGRRYAAGHRGNIWRDGAPLFG